MDLEKFADIVETMIIEHHYPGYDVRSLKLGLPQEVVRGHARTFAHALKHDSVYVKLAALRWFEERPSDGKRFVKEIVRVLNDSDEWVRREALSVLGRMDKVDEETALAISVCLEDGDLAVKKEAAKALGKLGQKTEPVLAALRKTAQDSNTELRWKAEKALRQLGAYS
jgi:HEAT repeat protein